MDEDLSSIDRSRTPWVIFIGWVNYLNFPLPIARLKIDQAGKPGCSIILAFVFLGLLCILESVLCLWDTINNIWHFARHCRHRPMYSSHGGILPNVDSNFVASVEPLLLNYQVKNHEVQNTLHHIIPEIIVVWSQCAIYGDMFWLCGE